MLTQSVPGHAAILATWYKAWPQRLRFLIRNLKAETRSGLNSAQGLGCWNLYPDGLPGQLLQTCCLIYQYLSFLICEVGITLINPFVFLGGEAVLRLQEPRLYPQ